MKPNSFRPQQLSSRDPTGGAGVSGRGVGAEALPEGRDGGTSREPRGSNPGGELFSGTFRFFFFICLGCDVFLL